MAFQRRCVRVTRLPAAVTARQGAALACARGLRLSFAEAQALLRGGPLTLPLTLPEAEAEALAQALSAAGAAAEVTAPPSPLLVCAIHPSHLQAGVCRGCGIALCALCQAQAQVCARCRQRARVRRRRQAARVAVLLLLLCGALAYAYHKARLREARARWLLPVEVEVVLLRRGPADGDTLARLRAELPRLSGWLAAQRRRYQPDAAAPFVLRPHGPVAVAEPPPAAADAEGLWARARAYRRLRAYLDAVRRDGALRLQPGAVQLYLALQETDTQEQTVEGFSAPGQDLGVVLAAAPRSARAQRDRAAVVDHALIALAHELLHLCGAEDKYDSAGHAVAPAGLAEPAAGYPQAFAELMVGEVPLAPGAGRLPEGLAEVRVGPATALEVGWLRAP